MSRNLGDLEQLVLLALVRLGPDAYGVTVQQEITARTGRRLAFTTIYTTLTRLETKGLVESFVGDPTPERGGRGKRFFVLTTAGRATLRKSLGAIRSMAQGLGGSWSTP